VRVVAVWLAALAAVAATTLVWAFVAPVYYGVHEELNTSIAAELEGQAKETYEGLWTFSDVIFKVAAPALIFTFIGWALLNMQHRERVTGVYG